MKNVVKRWKYFLLYFITLESRNIPWYLIIHLKILYIFSVSAITDEQLFRVSYIYQIWEKLSPLCSAMHNNQHCNQNCVEPSFFRQIAASVTKSVEGTVQQYPTSCSSNSRKEFSETGLINRKHGLDVVCGESTLLSGANST